MKVEFKLRNKLETIKTVKRLKKPFFYENTWLLDATLVIQPFMLIP